MEIFGHYSDIFGDSRGGGFPLADLVAAAPLLCFAPQPPLVVALSMFAAFGLFRLFDIWKPWPIRALDRSVHGGFGIMLDDLLAGAAAALPLWGALYAWTGRLA